MCAHVLQYFDSTKRSLNFLLLICKLFQKRDSVIPYGLVARISGFHPEGPGSIPGMGNIF